MNESGRSAETDHELKAKVKDKKDHQDHQDYQNYQENGQGEPDPYCCTPGGGDGGPDT